MQRNLPLLLAVPLPPAARLLLAALALMIGFCSWSAAQMDSPLKGVGRPSNATDKIFVSVYLDRLLDVDASNFRWEGLLYYFFSYKDPEAYPQMLRSTAAVGADPAQGCALPCRSVLEETECCDGVFRPSFSFTNAWGFPQDREVLSNLYPTQDGSTLWQVRVHGIWFQPMDFSHYPFDSFDLIAECRFWDPGVLSNHSKEYVQLKSSTQLVASSGGRKLYTYGKGDETNEWEITGFRLETYTVDSGLWFDTFSELKSTDDDPMPLAPANGSVVGRADGLPANVFTGVPDQMVAVVITIDRFWKSSLINSVLPVVLIFLLGMFVFFIGERELASRLEVIVALFLALTAVQFVLADTVPRASYIVPTQQLVLATYGFLFLMALESITVFHIVMRHQKREEAERRREAYRRYCKLRDRGKLQGGSNPPLSAADLITPGVSQAHELLSTGVAGASAQSGAAAAGGHAMDAPSPELAAASELAGTSKRGQGRVRAESRTLNGCFRGILPSARWPGQQTQRGHSAAPSGGVGAWHQITADEAYGEYLGHLVDTVAAAVLGLAYLIAAVLIFVLQNGYIDLFADDNVTARSAISQ
ncbi:hypothetical protein ABPG77_005517 [Micractinium sp. CCAP 211/92]